MPTTSKPIEIIPWHGIRPEPLTGEHATRDAGCAYHDRCLTCPFPICLYDSADGVARTVERARNAVIRQEYRRGLPVRQIALRHGVAYRSVYRIGSPKPQPPATSQWTPTRPTAPDLAAAIIDRYQAGEGIERIARTFKVGTPRVRQVLRDAGVYIRRRGRGKAATAA